MDTIFRFGPFEADRDRHQLRHGNRRVKLERIPLELLFLLLEQQGKIVTREQIVSRLWGTDLVLDTERSINTAIRKIRRALQDDARHPKFIETAMGKGYCFLPVAADAANVPASDRTRTDSDTTDPEHESSEPKEIRLSGFRIETVQGAAMLSCDIVRGDRTMGRLPLVRLDLPQDMTLPLKPEDKLLMRLLGVRVTLTAEAAHALQAFCIRYLQNGSAAQMVQPSNGNPHQSDASHAIANEIEQVPAAEKSSAASAQ